LERKEPILSGPSRRPGRLWRVVQRLSHHSAFSGYRQTPSRYSEVVCLRCGAVWRTAAAYVPKLADLSVAECTMRVWYKGHREAMEKFGRLV